MGKNWFVEIGPCGDPYHSSKYALGISRRQSRLLTFLLILRVKVYPAGKRGFLGTRHDPLVANTDSPWVHLRFT